MGERRSGTLPLEAELKRSPHNARARVEVVQGGAARPGMKTDVNARVLPE